MSLALKHIPCPAGDNCTAFQCIFGHASDKPKELSSPEQSGSSENIKQISGNGTPHDGPRKRAKLESQSAAGDADISRLSATSTPRQTSTPKTITRPISPPMLSRKTSPQTKTPKATASGTNGASTPRSNQASPNIKKPESLNPRLIKHSPASHDIRFRLVKMLHAEYKRLNTALQADESSPDHSLSLSDQDLVSRALDEEQKCAIEKASIYSNVMKNKILQYKRMGVAQWRDERFKELPSPQSKRKQSDTDEQPVKIETGLTTSHEVQLLHRLLTPIDKLANHGYVPTVPTEMEVAKAKDGLEAAMGWEKCDRCSQRFQVFPGRRADGALTTGGPCKFHWGKSSFPERTPGDKTRQQKRFLCCNQELGESSGCTTHPDHVFKASDAKRLSTVLNYATTPENDPAPKDRAVCFDCEMGYTVHGMELIRLTATSWPTGELLIDVLVKPYGEILDLNSRFSGVLTDDLAQGQAWSPGDSLKPDDDTSKGGSRSKPKLKVVASPKVARDLLFSQISPSTPLIGHGLENDLNAMRIVHPTLIDTILLFPHRAGLPYRYGLKSLMDRHLNRKIQQETGPKMLGHDSAEDARAAGDLARFKLMTTWQDMKRNGWCFINGQLVSPTKDNQSGTLTEAFIEGA